MVRLSIGVILFTRMIPGAPILRYAGKSEPIARVRDSSLQRKADGAATHVYRWI